MRYNDYDDELERMRSRKSRTAGRRPAGERPVRETARQREQYRDEPEDFYEEDYEMRTAWNPFPWKRRRPADQ